MKGILSCLLAIQTHISNDLLPKWHTLVWIWNKLYMSIYWQIRHLARLQTHSPSHFWAAMWSTQSWGSHQVIQWVNLPWVSQEMLAKIEFFGVQVLLITYSSEVDVTNREIWVKIFITVSEKGLLWKGILHVLPQVEWFLTLTLENFNQVLFDLELLFLKCEA